MRKLIVIVFILCCSIGLNAQSDEFNLRFVPAKIYDYFTNSHPNCIITNETDIKALVDMLGNETLVLSDEEYKNFNLSNYNIICVGNAKTNKFISTLHLPYKYDEQTLAIGDTVINSGGCNFMAVLNNPYCLSNNLLHIGKITKGYNNIFFKNEQFVLFKNDSIILEGKYYSYITNLPISPSEEVYQTEFYPNTQLVKFPKIDVSKIQIDTSIFKVVKTKDDLKSIINDISNKKVVLLGENHYFKTINEIEKDIIFELNRETYFPYLIIEKPYSYTPILNNFLSISNDKEAAKFFISKMDMIAGCVEDSIFYNDLRKWNCVNPNKKIQVLCTDIEHDYDIALEQFLIPKLRSVRIAVLKDSLTSVNYLRRINMDLKNIETNDEELYRLIDNLIQTCLAYNSLKEKGYNHFSEIRQKAILKKYEDTLFFGSVVKDSKFIVIAGSEHAGTKNKQNLSKDKEGYYLEYINSYTKGLTYSIRLVCLSYGIDHSLVYKENLKFDPTNYVKMLIKYKEAVKNNHIQVNDTVFIFNNYDSITKQLLEMSTLFKYPFYFSADNAFKFEKHDYISFQDMKKSEFYKNDYMKFDKIIVIPFSELFISR